MSRLEVDEALPKLKTLQNELAEIQSLWRVTRGVSASEVASLEEAIEKADTLCQAVAELSDKQAAYVNSATTGGEVDNAARRIFAARDDLSVAIAHYGSVGKHTCKLFTLAGNM